jgi:hypothetical protein
MKTSARKWLFVSLALLLLAVTGCDLLQSEETVAGNGIIVRSLDLIGVIPAPAQGEAPKPKIDFTGEYTVKSVTWTDITTSATAVNPVTSFLLGHTYTVNFILAAGDDRAFTGFKPGVWTAGNEPAVSTTNFYHFGADKVEQKTPSATGETIPVIITFPPVQAAEVRSLNLTPAIPAPVSGAAPAVLSNYGGEYTVGEITWRDITEGSPGLAVTPPAIFESDHKYTADFTLTVRQDRTFAGLEAGTWPQGLDPAASTTNFYHFDASNVQQAEPSSTGETIAVTVTFPPVQAPTVCSLNLTGIIPLPIAEQAPVTTVSYTGEYTIGYLSWKKVTAGEVESPAGGVFEYGTTYRAYFTLTAAAGRSFAGLSNGAWNFSQGASTTKFYHTGAAQVVQTKISSSVIDITITFPPLSAS